MVIANKNAELEETIRKYQSGELTSGTGSGGGSGDISNLRVGSVVGYNGTYYYDSWGKNPSGNWYSGQAGKVKVDNYSASKYGGQARTTGDFDVHISSLSGGDLGWVKKSQLFDTGGYTGEWSDGMSSAKNGKLAFLHQKEMVLNESDTANLLKAVETVRSFTDSIKTNLLGGAVNALSGIADSILKGDGSQKLEQDVHITAEFPNANSTAEIETALLNLTQRSAQYVAKTR